MNPDIFETAYFFSRIRVNRVLNHSGKCFEKAGCGFNELIHGFHVNGRSIRGKKKKKVSKRFGFNEQIHWFHVNDVNRESFREKKKSGFKYILIRVEVPYTHQYYECVLNMKAKMVCYVYLFLDLVRKVNF